MALKVLHTGRNRRGTPSPDIKKMVWYSHPEVEFAPYGPSEKGDVILGIHSTVDDKRDIRKVMYFGSIPTFRKNRKFISSLDHVIFISKFCRDVFMSKWDFNSNSVLLPIGPMPADEVLEPIIKTRSIEGPIQFLAVAKWYKRPYKRKQQIIELYHEYLKKEYPGSILHIVGETKDFVRDGVHHYRKSFGDDKLVNIVKNSHIHIIPTPFDEGPHSITESLHYRVPFVCSNNCSGKEYIDKLEKCGIEVETEETITTWQRYKELKPLDYSSKFVKNIIPYEKYFGAIKEIIDNFEEYTSWEWNSELNYKDQSDKLYNILKGQ